MIKIENLKKYFKGTLVLNIPSINLPDHGIVSIFGNNGAGKTTFLRIVADLLKPTSGTIEYLTGNNNGKFNATKVASYLDESFLIDYLSVEEYCQLVILINKLNRNDFIEKMNKWSDFFNYDKYKNSLLSELSTGNRNKIGVLSAILQNKPITLLDEPFANIDPTSKVILNNILKDTTQTDRLVVLSSHSIENLVSISEKILLIESGEIIADTHFNENTWNMLDDFFNSKVKL